MNLIANPNGKLTQDEMFEIGRLLLKAGYQVAIRDRKLDDNKKVKCIIYGVGGENIDG